MESRMSAWQAVSLSCIVGWVVASSLLDLTRRFRSLTQPSITRRVLAETPLILRLQKIHHGYLDNLFSMLSCVVSVPFYTGFLPLLFWSGHSKLGRQMTLLMAFCDYIGNSIKDIISAPRPNCPPVRRVTATKDEKENSMENGFPSSHALNTVCLSGYLLHYMTYEVEINGFSILIGLGLILLFVILIATGRVYLGMHSLIDVVAGIGIGLVVLTFWLTVHGSIDEFVISGKNVTSFFAGLTFLLCFAYPTPEFPTPSFEYHTAFMGVAFGIVSGVQQTYEQFHHEDVHRILSPRMPLPVFLGRILLGIPTILGVKFCSKALSKWLLPGVCNTLGIPIRSSGYIPALKGDGDDTNESKSSDIKHSGYLQRLGGFFPHQTYDVDTGIRFLQYAGLAWSVVDLVPSLFSRFRL